MSTTGAAVAKKAGVGDREFIFLMALISATSALAVDMLLPAFSDMRAHFNLNADSTRLSLTITLFLFGTGVGNLFYGPATDALGRKPILLAGMALYATAAAVSALAPSLTVLYLARFVWGFAAAGPRVLTQAIVRDQFAGQAMARVMTLIQTVFFIAPVVGPVLGKGLVDVGSWRWPLAFGVFTGVAVIVWSVRLEETLASEDRRPLKLGASLQGFKLVVQNRIAFGYAMSVTFAFSAFFTFLASTELMFEDIFDKKSWFVPYFSIMGLLMALTALTTNRLLRRITARNLALGAGFSYSTVALLMLIVTLSTDGLPPFPVWVAIFTIMNLCHTAYFPTAISLALEPMGELAGTASAVVGFMMSLGGGALAALVDRSIEGTVTPVAIGYLVYSAAALAAQIWARTGELAHT